MDLKDWNLFGCHENPYFKFLLVSFNEQSTARLKTAKINKKPLEYVIYLIIYLITY